MKKFFIFLLAAMVLVSSVSFAEDPASLSDEELLVLYRRVRKELENRNISAEMLDPEVYPGSDLWDKDMAERLETFLYDWHVSDFPDMLTVCSSDWKSKNENPDTELLRILGNRTTLSYTILSVSGEPADPVRNVKLIVETERAGEAFAEYFFTVTMVKEEDGLWYVDPGSLLADEETENEESRSSSMSFRDAVNAAGEYAEVGGDIEYLAVAAEKDGRYYRTVTILDDRAKELYMTAMEAKNASNAFEAFFDAYAWSLPVCYTEEITAKPKEQAELDAQAGKTVRELVEEGYYFYGSGSGEYVPSVADLAYGFFLYEFELDASFEEYMEHEGREDLESLKVKSGKFSGLFSLVTNLDYLADGTYQPQVVPNMTAEEAAAADRIPPLEEYSRKAWPLTAEEYAELQNNPDARFGQVYMIEGVIHQVLSRSPLRAIIYTGEDGQSQPVVIKCPAQLSFNWEAGDRCRIYADVSSACYIMPELTARYILTSMTEDPADEAR